MSAKRKIEILSAGYAAPLTSSSMERLTIGQLAKQARVNRETVRSYERRRLLQRPSRSIAGYRVFSDDALRRLRFIRHAKMLGFSLEEIGELLALRIHFNRHLRPRAGANASQDRRYRAED